MLFNCKDELVELLKKRGYNLVLLPRENIAPLQILSWSEKGIGASLKRIFTSPILDDRHATIQELFSSDSQPLPTPQQGDVVSNVKGSRSSEIGVDAGIELMLNFMSLPEGEKTESKKLALKAAFKSIEKVNFSFGKNASSVSISDIGLDSFLKDAEIKKEVGNTFRDLIKNKQIYIVTSVLKSNSFTMKGSNENNASVNLDIPKIKEILDGDLKGNVDIFQESGIKYKGAKPLVFGFKAVRLLHTLKDGKYKFKIENSQGIAVKNDEQFDVETLSESDNFLEFE